MHITEPDFKEEKNIFYIIFFLVPGFAGISFE